jgi:hypothetical protein
VVIDDLSLHYGDRGDWYVLKTPEALKQYGGAQAAQLLREMIALKFASPEAQVSELPLRQILGRFGYDHSMEDGGHLLYLFAAQDTDPGEGVSIDPVEQFAGVPDHYLIHVINPHSRAIVADAEITLSDYPNKMPDGKFYLAIDNGPGLEISLPPQSERTINLISDLQKQVDRHNDPDPLKRLKDRVYVGQVSQQDTRIGFWLIDPTASKLELSNVTGAARTDLHLSPTKLDLSQPSTNLPPEPAGEYQLTLPATRSGGPTSLGVARGYQRRRACRSYRRHTPGRRFGRCACLPRRP